MSVCNCNFSLSYDCNCTCASTSNEVTDSISVFKGSTLKLQFIFPFSLEDKEIFIYESKPESLNNPSYDLTDSLNGIINLEWSSDQISVLSIGANNRFRIAVKFSDESIKTYNNIKVNIK